MSNDRQARSGWGFINVIRADPHSFTSVYGSIEKDIVGYVLGTWVRTYYVWVLWEGHGMVHMLLTGRTDVAKRGHS
jgi:hypothetical protein